MAKKNPKTHKVVPQYYETEPFVPKKNLANKAPIQNASLGNDTAKMVPKHPGKSSGFSESPHNPGHRLPGGTKSGVKVPNVRLSGHPGAHHIGKR